MAINTYRSSAAPRSWGRFWSVHTADAGDAAGELFDDNGPNGHFAWILDPEGNKIERWEPKH